MIPSSQAAEEGTDGHPLPGRRLGDRRIRVTRPLSPYFRYAGPGTVTARPAASLPDHPLGRVVARTRRALFGRPLASDEEAEERLSIPKALAVFSSDNLSSVAYATEAIMFTLLRPAPRLLADDPHLDPDRHDPRHHRHLLSADDPRLSERRRQLHRRQGEPRAHAGAGRRRGAAGRLRPDRLGQRRGRRGRDHLRLPCHPGDLRVPSLRVDRRGDGRQPPRHPRERDGVRDPDLRLPGVDAGPDRAGDRSLVARRRPAGR